MLDQQPYLRVQPSLFIPFFRVSDCSLSLLDALLFGGVLLWLVFSGCSVYGCVLWCCGLLCFAVVLWCGGEHSSEERGKEFTDYRIHGTSYFCCHWIVFFIFMVCCAVVIVVLSVSLWNSGAAGAVSNVTPVQIEI